jgi:hypothetical protein
MSVWQKTPPAVGAFRQRLRHLREQEKYAAGPGLLERLPGRIEGPGFSPERIERELAEMDAENAAWVERHYNRRRAPSASIEVAVRAIYDEAEKTGTPAPNINELEKAVRCRLGEQGLVTTRSAIRLVSRRPEFGARRRPPGKRRNLKPSK